MSYYSTHTKINGSKKQARKTKTQKIQNAMRTPNPNKVFAVLWPNLVNGERTSTLVAWEKLGGSQHQQHDTTHN
jgi:hypothetical protein